MQVTIVRKGNKPYKYLRIAAGKWIRLHVYNWTQDNGPLPNGCVLRCIDGNTLNAQSGNWESITRAALLALNRDRKKQSESMRKSWRERKRKAAIQEELKAKLSQQKMYAPRNKRVQETQ